MGKTSSLRAAQIEWRPSGDGEPLVNDIVDATAWLNTNGAPQRLRLNLLDANNARWELLFRLVEGQWVATHRDGDWHIALNAGSEFTVRSDGQVKLRGRYAESGGQQGDSEHGDFEVAVSARVVRDAKGP